MARTGRDIGIVLGAFALASAVAALAGAANAGTAMTFGQLAFVAAALWVIVAD